MSEEAILHALSTIKEANNKAHDDLREFIRGGIKGIHLEMAANSEVTNKDIEVLSDRQAAQNSNVAKLQEESDKRKRAVDDFRRLEKGMKDYRKKWPYLAAGAVGFVLAVVILYDAIGINGIIDIFKSVK
jgi:hypothetical protein